VSSTTPAITSGQNICIYFRPENVWISDEEAETAAHSARLAHGDVGLILYSVFPIVRLSVEVCDCDYQDFFFSGLVDDSIGETPGLAPSRSL